MEDFIEETNASRNINFPHDIFPDYLKEYVEELARVNQISCNMPAVVSLNVLAGSTLGKVAVQCRRDKLTPINQYCVIVAPSGLGKTSVMKPAIHALQDLQSLLFRRWRQEDFPLAQHKVHTLEKRLRTEDRVEEEVKKLTTELSHYQNVLCGCHRILVEDITNEALADMLQQNNGKSNKMRSIFEKGHL